MNEKTKAENYPKLCATVELILLAFPSLYMVKSEFSLCTIYEVEKHFEHRTW